MRLWQTPKTSISENILRSSGRRLSPSVLGADDHFIYNYRAIVRERLRRLVDGKAALSKLIDRLSASSWSDLCRIYHTSDGVADTAVKELDQLDRGIQSDWLTIAVELIVTSLAPQQGQLTLIPCQPNASHRAVLQQALDLLRFAWPLGHAECEAAIERLVYVAGDGFVSCSIPSYFGCVFLSAKHSTTAASTLELLVHESAHHALSARQRFVRYSDGAKRSIASPLRQDARDQEAVLHAAFVCARVSFVMHAVMSRTHLESDFDEIRQRNLDALGRAIPTLKSTEGWTTHGIDLLKSLDRYWSRFSRATDPRLELNFSRQNSP